MPVDGFIKDSGISSATVCQWLEFFRQLVASILDFEDLMIGGPIIIVELYETKLGKQKYNKGHTVEIVWCVGAVERTSEKKCFDIPVEKRDATTMNYILDNYVKPGVKVYADCWKAYVQSWQDHGCEHHTVNFSVRFKGFDTVFIRIRLKV